ncbi:Germ cell-less protein-like 1 [Gryganskiella cystojenkinii]|nr:Germ cell-less protein-like 1 [Gryganskiella cystojenkinii]
MSSAAASSLAQDMLLAIRDQHLSDIVVIAFGQTFHLHRLILLRSGYFRSLILGQGDWIEKSRQSITLQFDDPYVNLQSFQRIIHWLYGIDCHYIDGDAPILFRPTATTGAGATVTANNNLGPGSHALTRSASSEYHGQSALSSNGRLGLGLQGTYSEKMPTSSMTGSGILFRRYDNILLDPSDKVDSLFISMYAAASYLNIAALMDELCSDISRRIRDNRGLIHYMEYAWRLNNGRAWDLILAQCFYTFFWNTYKSTVLQEMMVSPDMPLVGLIKVLTSESLYVPNEYERYHLVKRIMLRRLGLETEKLMNWVYDYHDQDWFMILKDLDDNGTWSYELSSDTFLNDLLDWESTSTTEYEDAVDTDHEWTPRELKRKSSQASAALLFEDDRAATPTAAESSSMAVAVSAPIPVQRKRGSNSIDLDTHVETGEAETEKKTSPLSPTLGTPISSPALSLSAVSITSDTLPRHQVRELLILMYMLHHSINYTHMSFDHLHQVLTDGLVLPSRIKDAFWRQHLLRRIAMSTSPNLPYLTAPSEPLYGRYHGADPAHRERRTPITSAVSRAKMTAGSTKASPSASNSLPVNSHGLLPIRFSTSLYISRQDLMTDGKHFTSSTFYGGSWWSIQVGNNLNADGKVGVFLSSAGVPRVVPNSAGGRSGAGGRTLGGSSTSRSSSAGIFSAFTSSAANSNAPPGRPPRSSVSSNGAGYSSQNMGNTASDNGECSSLYNRARDLNISYRIYMTSNVPEPPEYFSSIASRRLEEIRGSDYNQHPASATSSSQVVSGELPFRPRSAGGHHPHHPLGSVPASPDLGSTNNNKSTQMISSEDGMVCNDVFKPTEGWGYKESIYLTRVAKRVRDSPSKANSITSPSTGQHSVGGSVSGTMAGPPRTTTAAAAGLNAAVHPHQPFAPLVGHLGGLQQQPQVQPHQQQQQQQHQQQAHPLHQQAVPPPLHQPQPHHQPAHFPQLHNPHQLQQQHPPAPPQQQQQQHVQPPPPPVHGHPAGAGAQQQGGLAAGLHHGHGGGGQGHPTQQSGPPMTHQVPLSSMTGLGHADGPGHDESQDDGLWIHFVVKVGWSDRKGAVEKATV